MVESSTQYPTTLTISPVPVGWVLVIEPEVVDKYRTSPAVNVTKLL